MQKRVVVFDDVPRHLAEFRRSLEAVGCEVMAFDHCTPHQEAAAIRAFNPEVAVVDSFFKDEIDGLGIIRDLCELCPNIAIVVCSYFLAPHMPRREALIAKYERISAVRKLIPKTGVNGDVLPDPEAILAF
jgi:DNA-binding NarL/FixJ family response regulator